MKTVLITGASGFIGSYLCTYLIKNNFKVVALSEKFHRNFMDKLENCKLIKCDLLKDRIDINENIDFIIHLATANDVLCKQDFEYSLRLSMLGTKKLLDFCVEKNINKFLFFSTLQVYGTELSGNINEKTIVKPGSYYSLNHLYVEEYIKYFCKENNMDFIIARPSNVYGEFIHSEIERWSLVPGCFCKEAFEKGTVTLLSSGNQVRNFISLLEVSSLCRNMLNDFPIGANIYNFASREYFKIIDVAYKVKNIYEKRYNKTCEIQIDSTKPIESNNFNISLENVYKYLERNIESCLMERCICSLFDTLEYMKLSMKDV